MTGRTTAIVLGLVSLLLMPATAQEPPSATQTPTVQQSPAAVQPVTTEPLTIDEAVRRSVARNFTVQAARERADQAQTGISIARSGARPSLNATVEYTNTPSAGTFELPAVTPGAPPQLVNISSTQNTIAMIEARQSLYTGGRVSAEIDRATAVYDVSLGQLAATESQTALQTRETYYAAVLGQSLITSQEQTLAAAEQQLGVARAKFEEGAAAQFDVLRAQTSVSEAQQSLEEARNQARTSILTLNRLIAAPIAQDQQLVRPPMAPYPAQSADTLVSTALRQRGEVLASRAQLAAAEANIDIARAEARPELAVSATYQVVTNESPAQTTGPSFLALASMPIYEGGRIRANIRQTKYARDEARSILEDTLLQVEQEVRRQYLNLTTARLTIQTAETRLTQAQSAYDIAAVRYEAGVGTAVEIADALATLATARTNVERERFNYNIAYARLQNALGIVAF